MRDGTSLMNSNPSLRVYSTIFNLSLIKSIIIPKNCSYLLDQYSY